jgi:HEAT repeat protein
MIAPVARAIALLILSACPLLAADREAEAKRYAADLKSKDAKVRATAATELGKLGQLQRKLAAPYVTDLMKALTDSDAKVRGEAARALGLVDPEDKKEAITKVADLLKDEKSDTAREGQEMGLGELGATAEDGDVKRMARDALMDARKKHAESKREQKVIQAALLLINGPKKKN